MSGGKGGENIFETSNNMFNAGGAGLAVGMDRASNIPTIADGIPTYMNPYTSDVIDTTMADINRQREIALTGNEASAAAAGAFGGSRHGVVDSLTNEAAIREMASTSANLHHGGFTTAADMAANDIANFNMGTDQIMQGAGSMLGGAAQGQNMGMAATGALNSAGGVAQGINQGLITQSAGMFDQFVNQPEQMLALMSGAVGTNPLTSTGTATSMNTQEASPFTVLSNIFGAGAQMGMPGVK